MATGGTWTLVVAVTWGALAAWRPTTTWHLAPLMLAAAWPWVVRTTPPRGVPAPTRLVAQSAALGVSAALLVSVILWAANLLRGPTWWGSGPVLVEAVAMALAGAAPFVLPILVRRRTGPATRPHEPPPTP